MKAQASPAKRFFVEMLTRDIELADAILDLLDNCVDGALRSGGPDPLKPYSARSRVIPPQLSSITKAVGDSVMCA